MNLYDLTVPASLVEQATRGYATLNVQRAWVQRGIFFTPIPEPRAGKPRGFPLLSVYESALLSWAGAIGLPLSFIKETLYLVQGDVALEVGAGGLSVGNIVENARNNRFPEFLPRAEDAPVYYWVVLLSWIGSKDESSVDDDERGPLSWGKRTPNAVALKRGENLPELLEQIGAEVYPSGYLVIPVSEHVRGVNAFLKRAGFDLSSLPAIK